jgi:hypothetical protein
MKQTKNDETEEIINFFRLFRNFSVVSCFSSLSGDEHQLKLCLELLDCGGNFGEIFMFAGGREERVGEQEWIISVAGIDRGAEHCMTFFDIS